MSTGREKPLIICVTGLVYLWWKTQLLTQPFNQLQMESFSHTSLIKISLQHSLGFGGPFGWRLIFFIVLWLPWQQQPCYHPGGQRSRGVRWGSRLNTLSGISRLWGRWRKSSLANVSHWLTPRTHTLTRTHTKRGMHTHTHTHITFTLLLLANRSWYKELTWWVLRQARPCLQGAKGRRACLIETWLGGRTEMQTTTNNRSGSLFCLDLNLPNLQMGNKMSHFTFFCLAQVLVDPSPLILL